MSLPSALRSFSTQPLLKACRSLFKDTLNIPLSPLADSPITPHRFFRDAYRAERHDSIDKLFLVGRITDDSFHAATQAPADLDTAVAQATAEDYNGMFLIAADLGSRELTRSDLAARTRDINRTFSAPVIVVFKHSTAKQPVLSIGVASRRPHKRDHGKDVLGKVSMIREINLQNPHPGHVSILKDISFAELDKNAGKGKRGHKIDSYKAFHAALEQILDIQLLNENFYKKIQEWFFWASQEVRFPHGGIDDSDQRNRIAMIRLLTRVIFCWFAKEKKLLPAKLFDRHKAYELLKNFDPTSKNDSSYYRAFLQNLFFAVLSIPAEERKLRDTRTSPKGVNHHYMNHSRLRYRESFTDIKAPEELFAGIPFLNGGLFECLDYRDVGDSGNSEMRVDGFSDSSVEEKKAFVPNILFFGKEYDADLHEAYNNDTKKSVKVDGLFTILESFKFTVTENTPIDEEIALDPELLGRIFENLLAEYNPETKQTARKQTGSFYTPRAIVDYMVTEALKAHLQNALCKKLPQVTPVDAREGLNILFAYTEKEHIFTDEEKDVLVDAIYDVTVLDPACGSGAFPMGMLQKLVYVLDKLDHGHEHWKQRILKDTPAAIREETRAILARNSGDFHWKLGLIQHCIYGIDIQPIAVQIAKLRCFVSLLVDFEVNPDHENCGVPALPNLDFKFVAADSLILPPGEFGGEGELILTDPFFEDFARLAEDYFFIRDPEQKKKLRAQIEKLIDKKISERESTVASKREGLQRAIGKIAVTEKGAMRQAATTKKVQAVIEAADQETALWRSYRNLFAFRNAPVKFFDQRYFFPEIKVGFDITIGNPPYVTFKGKERVNVSDAYIQSLLDYYPNSAEYKINSYALFIDRGLRLLKRGGMLSFIIPSTLLQNENLEKARRLILGKHKLSKLLIIETKVFGAVTDSIVIFVGNSFHDGEQTATITANSLDLTDLDSNTILYDQKTWLDSHASIINTKISSNQTSIIASIENCSSQLGTILKVYVGVVASGMKKFLSPKALNKNYRKYLQGRDIGRFTKSPRELFINFDKERLHSNTDESVYLQNEKILVRKTGNFLLASYDDEQYFTDQSIYNLYAPTEANVSLKIILCFLNSSVLNFYFRKKMITNPDVFPYIKGIHLKQLPIKKHTATEVRLFELLVPLIQFAKRDAGASRGVAEFLEDLIDACVMECYFREHMAERNLLFHDLLTPHLADYDPDSSESRQRDFLIHLCATLNAPSQPIRQRLDRIPTASPDLLGIIQQEGKL